MPRRSARTSSSSSRNSAISTAPRRENVTARYADKPSQPAQPGIFGQMASTAAGVALGSTIGHTLGAGITSLFAGSSSRGSNDVADNSNINYSPAEASAARFQPEMKNPCESHNQAFLKCIESHSSDIAPCQFYLDSMKQCMENVRTV